MGIVNENSIIAPHRIACIILERVAMGQGRPITQAGKKKDQGGKGEKL